MYNEESFEKLEAEERLLTEEQLALMLLLLNTLGSDLEKEFRSFYQQYGKDGIVTYQEARKWVSEKDHRRRITVLMLLVDEKFSTLFDDLTPHFEATMRGVIEKESSFFGVEVGVEELLFFAWGADALDWLARLENNVSLWKYRLKSDIKQALLQGKNVNALLELMDDRVTSMKKVLNALGLTESTAIGSAARQEIFRELGITKYRFYSKADERTCEICGGMHNHIFPMSAYEVGSTASPLHPHCRCYEMPIVD